jgi:hypothetical protein
LVSKVAVWLYLATVRLPVAANVPTVGSYNSALARSVKVPPLTPFPPTTSTCPLPNNVAVWPALAVVMLPVAVNVPATGSYSSAVPAAPPPAMSTFPFDNNVAVV